MLPVISTDDASVSEDGARKRGLRPHHLLKGVYTFKFRGFPCHEVPVRMFNALASFWKGSVQADFMDFIRGLSGLLGGLLQPVDSGMRFLPPVLKRFLCSKYGLHRFGQ